MKTLIPGRRLSGQKSYIDERRRSSGQGLQKLHALRAITRADLGRDSAPNSLKRFNSPNSPNAIFPEAFMGMEDDQADTMRHCLDQGPQTHKDQSSPDPENSSYSLNQNLAKGWSQMKSQQIEKFAEKFGKKEYGTIIENKEETVKYPLQIQDKFFIDHGGNPPLDQKSDLRETYMVSKSYPCFPCITRTVKKKRSIFGIDPLSKSRKIREMWKSVIKKVILINRVFYTMKELNHDIKFFGATNRNVISVEQVKRAQMKEQIHKACCIVMPESTLKLFWSLVMILLLFVTMIYVPYRTAFIDKPSFWLMICEYIMDSLFAIDIILCFFSAYYDEDNNLITSHQTIAYSYLKGWFFLDVIATYIIYIYIYIILYRFPFGLLEDGGSSGGGYNKLLRLLRLPRLYRLMKILRLVKMIKLLKYSNTYEKISFYLQMNQGLVRLLKALAYMLFFVHFYGCAWFWFAKLTEFRPECWVVRYHLVDASQGAQYLASVYWYIYLYIKYRVLTTATTVGYGDIYPNTKTERGLAIVLMIFGVGFYSYTVGNLSAILNNMDQRNQELVVHYIYIYICIL